MQQTRFERMKELGPGEAGHAICNEFDCEDCPWFRRGCNDEYATEDSNGWVNWLMHRLKETEDI